MQAMISFLQYLLDDRPVRIKTQVDEDPRESTPGSRNATAQAVFLVADRNLLIWRVGLVERPSPVIAPRACRLCNDPSRPSS